MRKIQIIYSTNIMDMENRVNINISGDDNVIDVKLVVGFIGYCCVIMR
ncbi:MAG: hypothetical protein OER82_00075 [Nitrosopumilus sp.]|nr:hypothetical protein [Nitrosopumilus sp.]